MSGGLRMSLADLAQTRAWADPRNRERVAEAAGLGVQAREPADMAAREQASQPASEQASKPPEGWLRRLMRCDGWSDRRRRLSPEEQLSALVATELRRLTLAGELRAVWTSNRVEHRGGDPIARMIQHLQRVLGVIAGSADYVFTWETGSGWIELKTERPADLLDLRKDGGARAPARTYMRPIQRDFREWCASNGVRHAVARSVPEVTGTLRRWGRLP